MTRVDGDSGDLAITPILLAAGAGSRFCDVGHKLVAPLPATPDRPAETVFDRALAALLAAHIGRPIVVTGRLDAAGLGIAGNDPMRGADDDTDVEVVHNSAWADGQMTSVHAGITSAARDGADAVVVGLADQPGIEPGAWQAIANAIANGARIAVATYDGRRANPVGLHREVWDLLRTTGDEGARSLIRLRPDLVVEVPCVGSPNDIDTVEDLSRWQSN